LLFRLLLDFLFRHLALLALCLLLLLGCQLFLPFAVLLLLLPFLKVIHALFLAFFLFLRDKLLTDVLTKAYAEIHFEVFIVRPLLILPLAFVRL